MLCNWLDEKHWQNCKLHLNADNLHVVVGELQVKILNHVLLAEVYTKPLHALSWKTSEKRLSLRKGQKGKNNSRCR